MPRVAIAAVLALLVAGCSSTDDRGTDAATPSESAPASAGESGGESSGTDENAVDTGGLPEPGTAEAPSKVKPQRDLLDWQRQGDPLGESVTVGATYTLRISTFGERVEVDGAQNRIVRAPKGLRVSSTLLDDDYAVVISQDPNEKKPAVAEVIDLSTGTSSRLDGSSDPATISGGSWALGQGRLYHPTIGRDRAYCLAEVDLATGAGQTTYCAEKRTGFNQVRITPEGLSLLGFDDAQPSCRTIMTIGEAGMEPFPGVAECQGWEGMLMPDGAIWSVVEDENAVESGSIRARVGDGYYDLGPGLTGSLTWCDGAAYFSRNQQTDTEPARLMRWDGSSLAIVMEEGEGGPSQMATPRCGGRAIAVSVLAEKGDRQLSAALE